jgi:hypothetical protein
MLQTVTGHFPSTQQALSLNQSIAGPAQPKFGLCPGARGGDPFPASGFQVFRLLFNLAEQARLLWPPY